MSTLVFYAFYPPFTYQTNAAGIHLHQISCKCNIAYASLHYDYSYTFYVTVACWYHAYKKQKLERESMYSIEICPFYIKYSNMFCCKNSFYFIGNPLYYCYIDYKIFLIELSLLICRHLILDFNKIRQSFSKRNRLQKISWNHEWWIMGKLIFVF